MFVRVLTVVAILVAFMCSPTWADIEWGVGDSITVSKWNAGQAQGPYSATVTKVTDSAVETFSFFVFCAEAKEYFYPGTPYEVTGIGDTTMQTGKKLTGYTAWVFHKFATMATSKGWSPTGTPPSGESDYTANAINTWGEVMNYYQASVWAGLVDPAKNPVSTGVGGAGTGSELDQTSAHWNNLVGQVNFTSLWDDGINSIQHTLGISKAQFEADATWTDGTKSGYDYIGGYQIIQLYNPNTQDFVFAASVTTLGQPIPEPTSVAIWSLIAMGFVCGSSMVRRRRRFTTGGCEPQGWSPKNRMAIRQIVERGRQG